MAAQLTHVAAMRGDLDGDVVDLGTGTGRLAFAAACHRPASVTGVELDENAIAVARNNASRVDPPVEVSWVVGDVRRLPLERNGVTVVSNPPFGAQQAARSSDRAFLKTTADVADTSYTLHNEGSRSFVESFAADNGGRVTDAFAVAFEIDRQFTHHTNERVTIDAEAFRIDWNPD